MSDPRLIDQLRRIFLEKLHIETAGVEADLVESGILDSSVLIDLIFHIEDQFSITVPLDNLQLENLRSISSIAAVVSVLLKAQNKATPAGL